MIRNYWKPIVIGLAAGLLGTVLVLVAVHLWQDHRALHEVIAWANQVGPMLAQQAAKAAGK